MKRLSDSQCIQYLPLFFLILRICFLLCSKRAKYLSRFSVPDPYYTLLSSSKKANVFSSRTRLANVDFFAQNAHGLHTFQSSDRVGQGGPGLLFFPFPALLVLPLVHIPDKGHLVAAPANEPPPILANVEAPRNTDMSLQHGLRFDLLPSARLFGALGEVPHPDARVDAGREKSHFAGLEVLHARVAPGYRRDDTPVAAEDMGWESTHDVPNLDRPIGSS